MKLICRRATFIPGFCVFALQHKDSGVSPPHLTVGRAAQLIVTRNVSKDGPLSTCVRAIAHVGDGGRLRCPPTH